MDPFCRSCYVSLRGASTYGAPISTGYGSTFGASYGAPVRRALRQQRDQICICQFELAEVGVSARCSIARTLLQLAVRSTFQGSRISFNGGSLR